MTGGDQQRQAPGGGEGEVPSIPDHQLLTRIGRGSYGDVWLARNLMGVYRAVKIIHRGRFSSSKPFERELAGIRKYEPVSRHHEGLVDVLHVGTNRSGDCFYYVMELADDVNTGQAIDPAGYRPTTLHHLAATRGRMPAVESLELGLALSGALGFLHKNGLVHRDVKPSNIVFVNGTPKLADIGLVAGVDDAHSYVGTEGFIPPEGPGTPQADCYSLGKVLYEISTGKDRHDFPELPTHLDAVPDRDRLLELNEITIRACNSDLARRYTTALDMHADLVVVLNGKSVRRLRQLERQLAGLKRALAAAAIVTLVVSAVSYHLYREFRFKAEQRHREIGASMGRATAAIDSGNYLQALPPLAEALRLDDVENQREHRIRFASVRDQCPTLTQLLFLPAPVNDLDFSSDGTLLAAAGDDGALQVYDLATGTPTGSPIPVGGGLRKVSFGPTGKRLLAVDSFSSTTIWSALSGAMEVQFKDAGLTLDARFNPDGSQVVTAGKDGVVRVWEVDHPDAPAYVLNGHTQAVLTATFSRDGRYIASGGRDRLVILWDTVTRQRVGLPMHHDNWVNCVNFSPDSSRIVASVSGPRIPTKAVIWEVPSCRRLQPELGHGGPVSAAEYSPDGLMIASASMVGKVHFWDAASSLPVPLNPTFEHGQAVRQVRFAPDCRRIAVASGSQVWLWDLSGAHVAPKKLKGVFSRSGNCRVFAVENELTVLDGIDPRSPPRTSQTGLQIVACEPNHAGTLAVITGRKNSVTGWRELWSLETMRKLDFPGAPAGTTNQVAAGPQGRRAARITPTELELLDLVGGTSKLWRHGVADPKRLEFSPDETLLVVATGSTAHVFNADSGAAQCEPLTADEGITVLTFSSGSRMLAVSSRDTSVAGKSIVIWDLQNGRRIGRPMHHEDGVLALSFSPDNRLLASGSEDGTAVLWNSATGEALHSFEHLGQVLDVAFSADGKWLATISSDRTARLFDVQSGECLTAPIVHESRVQTVGLLLGEPVLITSDQMGMSWIWPVHEDLQPSEDIGLLAGLLNGFAHLPSRQSNLDRQNAAQAIWKALRSRSAASFDVSREEALEWHLTKAGSCIAAGRRQDAELHLRQALLFNPEDTRCRELVARLEQP